MCGPTSIIIYLTGKPGVGKYTIAQELTQELAESYGLIICDNQLINNPIFQLLQYDGYAEIPEFAWDSIAKIRTEVFKFLTKVPWNSYVLTNNLYEDAGDRALYEECKDMAEKRGSLFIPVKLLINKEEHLRRVTNPKRRERWKSIDPKDVYDKTPLLYFTDQNLLELEVSHLSAKESAQRIMNHVNRLKDLRGALDH
jgi:hypothetical protein